MNCKNCGYGLKLSRGDFEKILCTYEEGECVKITELEKQLEETKLQNAICEEGLKKQIAEVEQEVKLWKKASENNSYKAFQLKHENTELKEQNTNLQEMLKTERSVTYKEEYLKKVTELEQENAELKDYRLKTLAENQTDVQKYAVNLEHKLSEYDDHLTKAKEILREYIRINLLPPIERNFDDEVKLFKEAEQFLKEETE